MSPKPKSSDVGNVDMPKRSHKVILLNGKEKKKSYTKDPIHTEALWWNHNILLKSIKSWNEIIFIFCPALNFYDQVIDYSIRLHISLPYFIPTIFIFEHIPYSPHCQQKGEKTGKHHNPLKSFLSQSDTIFQFSISFICTMIFS